MEPTAPRRRLPLLVRLLLVLLATAAAAVPVGLLVPDDVLSQVLALYFPPTQFDLQNADLLLSWRVMLAIAAGGLFCVVCGMVLGGLRALVRRRRRRAAPDALRDLRQATARGDWPAVVASSRRIAETMGDEAVPELLGAIERAADAEARQVLAESLYQVGRVVTAEVSLHPRR